MGISDKLLQEVKALIDDDKKLHAVKKLVEDGDMGLREAKHYVDTMQLDSGQIERPKINTPVLQWLPRRDLRPGYSTKNRVIFACFSCAF